MYYEAEVVVLSIFVCGFCNQTYKTLDLYRSDLSWLQKGLLGQFLYSNIGFDLISFRVYKCSLCSKSISRQIFSRWQDFVSFIFTLHWANHFATIQKQFQSFTDVILGSECILNIAVSPAKVDVGIYVNKYSHERSTAILIAPNGQCLFVRLPLYSLFLTGSELVRESSKSSEEEHLPFSNLLGILHTNLSCSATIKWSSI